MQQREALLQLGLRRPSGEPQLAMTTGPMPPRRKRVLASERFD